MFDFGHTWIRSYRDGGWGEAVKLRPGQVSVHDGDVTTNVYDLSGLGRGVGKEFREWARENWRPGDPVDPVWHPVVRDECRTMLEEARRSGVFDYEDDNEGSRS